MATIRQRAPQQWQVLIRRKGWPKQSGTFHTKKDATAWARKIESDMDRSVFVDQTRAYQTTLGDLIRRYLADVTDKRPGIASRVSERARLLRFLREEKKLCAYAIAHLRPEHFEAYRDRRLKQPVKGKEGSAETIKPGTVKRELTLLKRVIDHGKRALGLLVNPVNTEDVKRPTVKDHRDVRLSPEELHALIAACGQARNTWLRPIVLFALETGARRGSILGLKWADVDLKKRTATLRNMKNSRSPDKTIDHTVPLSPKAIEVLVGLDRSEGGRVFPISENALRLAFNRARAKAGLPHFRFHDIRHERTSSLFEAGWSLIQVMALTGHQDPKSVKRYANLNAEKLAKELEKIPSIL